MDDFGVDRTTATLESALADLTLDAESRPTKRRRTGEAKLAQHLTDDTLAKRVDCVTSTKAPPYFTTEEWQFFGIRIDRRYCRRPLEEVENHFPEFRRLHPYLPFTSKRAMAGFI